MRFSSLSGFGSLGLQIEEPHLNDFSDEDILTLGERLKKELVLVVPSSLASITPERLHSIQSLWGQPCGAPIVERIEGARAKGRLTRMEAAVLSELKRMKQGLEHLDGIVRVTGIRDAQGRATGMFADGELEWHSNQQADQSYAPLIGLQAVSGSQGSVTEFCQTVDAYQDLSSSWRSMVDELIAVHCWQGDRLAPGLNQSQLEVLHLQMCPDDGVEIPLKAFSPAGFPGMHFSYTTLSHFKGLSHSESQKIISELKAHILQDKYIYRHAWQDGDIVWMDQVVTLHRRPTKDCSQRLMYRMLSDWSRTDSRKGVEYSGDPAKHMGEQLER